MLLFSLKAQYNFLLSMLYNAKQTHLIIHKQIQYALETTEQSADHKYQAQIGPVNSKNKRQLWLLEGQKGGSFQIINGFTDQVLTQSDNTLILQRGQGNRHQTWIFQFVSDNQFHLKLAKSKKRYVCVESGCLIFRECEAPISPDTWLLKPVLDNEVLKKSCFIISTKTKKLIDIPEASRKQGTQLLTYHPNYRYNQRWNIYKAGEIYVIKSYFNEMNLDVFQERFDHHTPLIQWPSHGGVNQFWVFERVSSEPIFRISTFFNRQLQIGHSHDKLVLNKGKEFTWLIEGYFPQ